MIIERLCMKIKSLTGWNTVTLRHRNIKGKHTCHEKVFFIISSVSGRFIVFL